jgi:hypothetical protein
VSAVPNPNSGRGDSGKNDYLSPPRQHSTLTDDVSGVFQRS